MQSRAGRRGGEGNLVEEVVVKEEDVILSSQKIHIDATSIRLMKDNRFCQRECRLVRRGERPLFNTSLCDDDTHSFISLPLSFALTLTRWSSYCAIVIRGVGPVPLVLLHASVVTRPIFGIRNFKNL
jgi:hypothetical protein